MFFTASWQKDSNLFWSLSSSSNSSNSSGIVVRCSFNDRLVVLFDEEADSLKIHRLEKEMVTRKERTDRVSFFLQ